MHGHQWSYLPQQQPKITTYSRYTCLSLPLFGKIALLHMLVFGLSNRLSHSLLCPPLPSPSFCFLLACWLLLGCDLLLALLHLVTFNSCHFHSVEPGTNPRSLWGIFAVHLFLFNVCLNRAKHHLST